MSSLSSFCLDSFTINTKTGSSTTALEIEIMAVYSTSFRGQLDKVMIEKSGEMRRDVEERWEVEKGEREDFVDSFALL